MLNKII